MPLLTYSTSVLFIVLPFIAACLTITAAFIAPAFFLAAAIIISIATAALIGGFILKWAQRKKNYRTDLKSAHNDRLRGSTALIIEQTLCRTPESSHNISENASTVSTDPPAPEQTSVTSEEEAIQVMDNETLSESENYPKWDGLGPFGDNILFI